MDKSPENFDFKRLLLKTPFEEFNEYTERRLRSAERLGDDDFEVLLEAVELGRKLLKGDGK